MMTRMKHGRLAAGAALVVALALLLLGAPAAPRALAAESLSVNLASVTGPATGVGEGFLYGISQDGTQPADQYLEPLGITAFRGGGHVTGGWIDDGYTYGSGTQPDVATVLTQAKRLPQAPYPPARWNDPIVVTCPFVPTTWHVTDSLPDPVSTAMYSHRGVPE